MTKESDPNFATPESSTQNKLRRSVKALRKLRLAVLLIQLILGSMSTLLLLLIVANIPSSNSFGINFGLFCSVCGLIFLIVCIGNSLYFGKIINRLGKTHGIQSTRSATKKIIKISISSSLVGMCLSLISVNIIGWIILSRIFFEAHILLPSYDPSSFISVLHVSNILASANILAAHFADLTSSLWTSNQIEKLFFDNQSPKIKY